MRGGVRRKLRAKKRVRKRGKRELSKRKRRGKGCDRNGKSKEVREHKSYKE